MRTFEITPPIIGHRGACGLAPENTMVAFSKAATSGIRWVEFDIVADKFGEPIVFHDEVLNRTTNGNGFIADFPYQLLQTLDAGSWFDVFYADEKIPTLKQVLPFLAESKVNANIEIKAMGKNPSHFIRNLLAMVAPFYRVIDILFSSFTLQTLELLREFDKHIWIGLLQDEWDPAYLTNISRLNCVSAHLNYEVLTSERVSIIKSNQIKLLSYTINDLALAKKMFALGVDAIFTDFPNKMMAYDDDRL